MKTIHDSETLAVGKQVIVGCAFVHHNFNGVEKVFVAKRADTKRFLPGVFEIPGGHIDFGEDIVAGLKREVYEEFTKRVIIGDPFAVFTYNNPIKRSHSIEVVYFARFEDGEDNIVLHPEDHSSYRWISENEIENLLIDGRNSDDEEIQALRKGFSLLRGERPNFVA